MPEAKPAEEWPDDGEWRKARQGPGYEKVSQPIVGNKAFKGDPNAAEFIDDLLPQAVMAGIPGGAIEEIFVYRGFDLLRRLKYVGITNNLARRAAEQLASKGIQIEKLLGPLSRSQARSVEQALIEIHKLGKNGGALINKINSIARSNPEYAKMLEEGYNLLKSIGYK